MPTYVYECPLGHEFEVVTPLAAHSRTARCDCGAIGMQVITAPAVFASRDICYDSPIDGRPITSMRARLDDLARNDCIEYDPEIKKDHARRIEREQLRLEKSVDETVEAAIEAMPSRKRERLEQELKAGADCLPERQTAPFTTLTKVNNGH